MILTVLYLAASLMGGVCAFCFCCGYFYGRRDNWLSAAGAFWAAMWLAIVSGFLSLIGAQYLAAALGVFIALVAFFSTYDARDEARKHDDQ